jgi:hypothetical protein
VVVLFEFSRPIFLKPWRLKMLDGFVVGWLFMALAVYPSSSVGELIKTFPKNPGDLYSD